MIEEEGTEEFLVWHEISDLCSQYLASMVCVRVQKPLGVQGFLMWEISSLMQSGDHCRRCGRGHHCHRCGLVQQGN